MRWIVAFRWCKGNRRIITKHLLLWMLVINGFFVFGQGNKLAALPESGYNLVLKAPISSWDEAIPLGNGIMGGLLWGEDNTIRLSLDRGDLWDERTNGLKDWWKVQTWAKGGDMWEKAYHGATPTKLPAGAVEIALADEMSIQSFELNKATAEGIVHLGNERQVRMFFSAVKRIAIVYLSSVDLKAIEVLSPLQVSARYRGESAGPDSHSINKLGYPAATNGEAKNAKWYVQKAADGLEYCVYTETRQLKGESVTAIAITTSSDGKDLLALARKRCSDALNDGVAKTFKQHTAWWRSFWEQSQIQVPEPRIQRYYTFARYLYGAGSRADAPPMPLQGVWTSATGSLPPWKGDYHSDLNTQMTYTGYQAAGNFKEGSSYLNFLWDKRDVWRAFAKDFYETPGLAVPGVMSLSGQPLGGWGAYSLSPTMTSWNAHLFYLHWRYTADDTFLRTRAYQWCHEAAQCLRSLLKPGPDGKLKLLRSSSPEIFGNSWLEPNTNYDIMCMRMHFLEVAEMAQEQGLNTEAESWRKTAAKLGDFHVSPDGELMLDAKRLLRENHRHPSNLMAIYPFNLMTVEGSDEDRKRINTTLERKEWNAPKHFEWCGYTWAWMSCLYARVGEAELAYQHLDVFEKAYISRNGFHVNQDQSSDTRFGAGGGRPFTLEGNFIAMQAVQEMLLQSWSATPGEVNTEIIRIFPAVPKKWADVSFNNLRAEGGYKVSASKKDNKIVWFSIVAAKTGITRIKDTFEGQIPKWNLKKVIKDGELYKVKLFKGQKLEAVF